MSQHFGRNANAFVAQISKNIIKIIKHDTIIIETANTILNRIVASDQLSGFQHCAVSFIGAFVNRYGSGNIMRIDSQFQAGIITINVNQTVSKRIIAIFNIVIAFQQRRKHC